MIKWFLKSGLLSPRLLRLPSKASHGKINSLQMIKKRTYTLQETQWIHYKRPNFEEDNKKRFNVHSN